MNRLKPGDPCPCCGRPIPAGLDAETMVKLSRLAEVLALNRAMKGREEKKNAQ